MCFKTNVRSYILFLVWIWEQHLGRRRVCLTWEGNSKSWEIMKKVLFMKWRQFSKRLKRYSEYGINNGWNEGVYMKKMKEFFWHELIIWWRSSWNINTSFKWNGWVEVNLLWGSRWRQVESIFLWSNWLTTLKLRWRCELRLYCWV